MWLNNADAPHTPHVTGTDDVVLLPRARPGYFDPESMLFQSFIGGYNAHHPSSIGYISCSVLSLRISGFTCTIDSFFQNYPSNSSYFTRCLLCRAVRLGGAAKVFNDLAIPLWLGTGRAISQSISLEFFPRIKKWLPRQEHISTETTMALCVLDWANPPIRRSYGQKVRNL